MRDVNGGRTDFLLNAADLGPHLNAEVRVEVGKRLVKEQDARLHDQSARQRDTLLLTARKLVGHAVFHAGQLDEIEDREDLLADLLLAEASELQAVRDVVVHVHVRKQRVVLEHHRGIALVRRLLVDLLVAEIDLADVRALKARDHTQGRGLAASGRSEQRHEFAGLDVQRHVVDRVEFLLRFMIKVDLGDMIQ